MDDEMRNGALVNPDNDAVLSSNPPAHVSAEDTAQQESDDVSREQKVAAADADAGAVALEKNTPTPAHSEVASMKRAPSNLDNDTRESEEGAVPEEGPGPSPSAGVMKGTEKVEDTVTAPGDAAPPAAEEPKEAAAKAAEEATLGPPATPTKPSPPTTSRGEDMIAPKPAQSPAPAAGTPPPKVPLHPAIVPLTPGSPPRSPQARDRRSVPERRPYTADAFPISLYMPTTKRRFLTKAELQESVQRLNRPNSAYQNLEEREKQLYPWLYKKGPRIDTDKEKELVDRLYRLKEKLPQETWEPKRISFRFDPATAKYIEEYADVPKRPKQEITQGLLVRLEEGKQKSDKVTRAINAKYLKPLCVPKVYAPEDRDLFAKKVKLLYEGGRTTEADK